jgi:hypothetical protein
MVRNGTPKPFPVPRRGSRHDRGGSGPTDRLLTEHRHHPQQPTEHSENRFVVTADADAADQLAGIEQLGWIEHLGRIRQFRNLPPAHHRQRPRQDRRLPLAAGARDRQGGRHGGVRHTG